MSHKSNILFSFLCLCFWHTASAQQTALSYAPITSQESMLYNISDSYLQKLIDTAKTNYPRLQVYNKRIENAETEVKRTKLGWFDALSFSWLYSPNNATTLVNPTLLNGYQAGMFVNFGSLMQRPAQIKKAKIDVGISKAEKEEYELNLTTLVKQRYYLYIQAFTVLEAKVCSPDGCGKHRAAGKI